MQLSSHVLVTMLLVTMLGAGCENNKAPDLPTESPYETALRYAENEQFLGYFNQKAVDTVARVNDEKQLRAIAYSAMRTLRVDVADAALYRIKSEQQLTLLAIKFRQKRPPKHIAENTINDIRSVRKRWEDYVFDNIHGVKNLVSIVAESRDWSFGNRAANKIMNSNELKYTSNWEQSFITILDKTKGAFETIPQSYRTHSIFQIVPLIWWLSLPEVSRDIGEITAIDISWTPTKSYYQGGHKVRGEDISVQFTLISKETQYLTLSWKTEFPSTLVGEPPNFIHAYVKTHEVIDIIYQELSTDSVLRLYKERNAYNLAIGRNKDEMISRLELILESRGKYTPAPIKEEEPKAIPEFRRLGG